MTRINDRPIRVNKLPFTEFSRPSKKLNEALKEQPTSRSMIETEPLSNAELIGLLAQRQNTFVQSQQYFPKSEQSGLTKINGGRRSRRDYV